MEILIFAKRFATVLQAQLFLAGSILRVFVKSFHGDDSVFGIKRVSFSSPRVRASISPAIPAPSPCSEFEAGNQPTPGQT